MTIKWQLSALFYTEQSFQKTFTPPKLCQFIYDCPTWTTASPLVDWGLIRRQPRLLIHPQPLGTLEWWKKQANGNRFLGTNLHFMRIVFNKKHCSMMLFKVELLLAVFPEVFSLAFDKVICFHVMWILKLCIKAGVIERVMKWNVVTIRGSQKSSTITAFKGDIAIWTNNLT